MTTGLSVTACAERLDLHTNTVRYRLARVESELGRSLQDMAAVVDLYIALLAVDDSQPSGLIA
jgi:DNA-binding PucR family transcriptional regulator